MRRSRGGILIVTLVFVTMFVIIFAALTGLVTRSYHQAVLQTQDEVAFQIAESGLNYARWRLAHAPGDFSSVTKEVSDQFTGVLGSYTLTFTQPQAGSTLVVIKAEGQTAAQPARTVRLRARYGVPSLARYASLTNDDVWYGGEIKGAVHANGGIRMDGQSDSLMTSARETYICQPYHECNPATIKPGVWGTGEKKELWEFPVPVVDYAAITADLLDMKTAAQTANTYYGLSGKYGYHIVFNTNNTYTIYKVNTKGTNVWTYIPGPGYVYTSHDIGTQSLVETKAVPANGIIFVEDTLWVKGAIQGRITVAAGRFPDSPATNADIIINGDITYSGVRDGTRVFGAVAQRHVLIPWAGAEDVLELDGAFIAQKGRFIRPYYYTEPHRLKAKIERYGMIASSGVPATTWVNGSGQVISGYKKGEAAYDPNLLYGPPPYFPTGGDYQFISWEELSPGEQ